MKTKQKKEQKKVFTLTSLTLLIVLLISGATFAYWSWETNSAQRTDVSVKVVGGSLTIKGTNVTKSGTDTAPGMVPTKSCTSSYALVGTATVTAYNQTTTIMRVYPMLDITLTEKQQTLDNEDKGHIHWAVMDITSGDKSCTSADYQGTFANVAKTTINKTTVDSATNFDIGTITAGSIPSKSKTTMQIMNLSSTAIPAITDSTNRLTFTAAPTATTTKKYKVVVWLDDTYTHTNSGSTVSDPMQNLNIVVAWSPNSLMLQEFDPS